MITVTQSSFRGFAKKIREAEFPLSLIVGAQRSGTTWLQLMCAAHPRIAGGEESHLFSHYLGTLSNQYYCDLASQDKLPRPQGLPCYLTSEEWVELMRHIAVTVLEKLVIAKPLARVIVEKTPDHVQHLHFVRSLFPNVKIVHVVRDARDVVVSQMEASRRKWGQTWAASDATEAATRWKDWVESAREYREPINLYHEVRYEDLIHNGVDVLRATFEFLGTPLPKTEATAIYNQFTIEACRNDATPPGVLRLGEIAQMPPRKTSEGFFRAGKAGGWRDVLSSEDRATVEGIAGPLLAQFGYDVEPDKSATTPEPVSQ